MRPIDPSTFSAGRGEFLRSWPQSEAEEFYASPPDRPRSIEVWASNRWPSSRKSRPNLDFAAIQVPPLCFPGQAVRRPAGARSAPALRRSMLSRVAAAAPRGPRAPLRRRVPDWVARVGAGPARHLTRVYRSPGLAGLMLLAAAESTAAAGTAIPFQVAPVGRPATDTADPATLAAVDPSPCDAHCPGAASTRARRPDTDARRPRPSPPRRAASIREGPGSPCPQPASTAGCPATAEPAKAPLPPGRPAGPAAHPDRRDRRNATASAPRPRTHPAATADHETSRKRLPRRPDWPTRGRTRECSQVAPRSRAQGGSRPGQVGRPSLGISDSTTFSWISPRQHDFTAGSRCPGGIPGGCFDLFACTRHSDRSLARSTAILGGGRVCEIYRNCGF